MLPENLLLLRPARRNRRGCTSKPIPASRQPVFSSHPTPATLHIRNIPGTLEVSHHPPHLPNSLQSPEHSSPSRRNILILRRPAFLDHPHTQELCFASHIKDVFLHYRHHRHCGYHCQRRVHQHLVDAFQRVCLDPKHFSRRISMDSQQ